MQSVTKLITNGLRVISCNAQQLMARNFHTMLRTPATTTTTTALTAPPITALTPIAAEPAGFQRLLAPFNALFTQVSGFKVKARLKRRCKDCYFVVRQQRYYVICPTHPRHKQMSMKKRDYKSWILTHATQSKERAY